MKKRLIAMLLVFCMACGVTACGGSKGEKVSLITIGGKEYDLGGEFQDVVGAMVKDGVKVTSLTGEWMLYDEDGKFVSGSSALKEGYDIAAEERNQTDGFDSEKKERLVNERGYFIRRDYYLDDMEAIGITSLGVSSINDVDDCLDKENFFEIEGNDCLYINGNRGYVGIFVNGEALDFSEYEDELEEFKDFTVTGYGGIVKEFFSPFFVISIGRLCGDLYQNSRTYDELKGITDRLDLSLDKELLVMFALEDAYKQLEDEKADSFAFVCYGVSDEKETVNLTYHHFYFDKTWSEEKFATDDVK